MPTPNSTTHSTIKPSASGSTPTGDPGTPGHKPLEFSGPVPGGTGKTFGQVLGEIVWIMSQSLTHKTMFIADLEWMVMMPIAFQQFRLFYDEEKPIGVALWAFANDDVEARLFAGGARMRPQDWKSGEKLWIVDIISPWGEVAGERLQAVMLKDLKDHVFPDRTIHMRGLVDGKVAIKTV
jgi:cytolysin-activating lysine-acyltransferase